MKGYFDKDNRDMYFSAEQLKYYETEYKPLQKKSVRRMKIRK
jgi:hypothetical protein